MIWHPLALSFISLDLLSCYFLFWALLTSGRIVLHWSAGAADSRQILLEAAAETASLQGRICMALQFCSFVLILFSIATVFPKLVPGAMCGTGVLQASGETGLRMLLVRAGGLIALFVWHQLDRNNRLLEEGLLSEAVAKGMLLSSPFILMGIVLSMQMVWQLNVEQAVDCCAVIYDQFGSAKEAALTMGGSDSQWLACLSILSILLFGGAFRLIMAPVVTAPLVYSLFCVALFWGATASITLVHIFSSYHYGVLHHHCPWCLFLPEHYSVGYPLFFAIGVVLLESVGLVVSHRSVLFVPELASFARKRMRQCGLRLAAAMFCYFLFAVVPALVWRVSHGVWIS